MAEGPFTIVWEDTADAPDEPGAVWKQRTKDLPSELEAVQFWEKLHLYMNTRPCSIDPEPDWDQYHYSGRASVGA